MSGGLTGGDFWGSNGIGGGGSPLIRSMRGRLLGSPGHPPIPPTTGREWTIGSARRTFAAALAALAVPVKKLLRGSGAFPHTSGCVGAQESPGAIFFRGISSVLRYDRWVSGTIARS